jgi:hypothetical protein
MSNASKLNRVVIFAEFEKLNAAEIDVGLHSQAWQDPRWKCRCATQRMRRVHKGACQHLLPAYEFLGRRGSLIADDDHRMA